MPHCCRSTISCRHPGIPRGGKEVVGSKEIRVGTAAAIGNPRGSAIVAIGRVDPSALEQVAVGGAIKRRAIGTGARHTDFIRRPPTAGQGLPTGLDHGVRIGNSFDTTGRSGALRSALRIRSAGNIANSAGRVGAGIAAGATQRRAAALRHAVTSTTAATTGHTGRTMARRGTNRRHNQPHQV